MPGYPQASSVESILVKRCVWTHGRILSSVAQLCPTLCGPMDCSTPGLPVHHQPLEVTQIHVHWVSDAIQPSHSLLPPSPAFKLSQHPGLFQWVSSSHQVAKYWSCSFSISPMNIQDWYPLGWTGWISLQSKGLSSLLQHHSSKASVFQSSAFFMVQLSHPYMTTGKTIALTRQTFVGKVMSLLSNMLSRLAITFLPRSKHLSISWLQSPPAVILEPKKIKSATVSPSICHEVMGPDVMILVFWMLSFKPTFSLSSFTLIKRLFSSSPLSAIKVVSSAYLRLLIFLPAILISACASSSPAFLMMYSAYKLNKQGDNIQPWSWNIPNMDCEPGKSKWLAKGNPKEVPYGSNSDCHQGTTQGLWVHPFSIHMYCIHFLIKTSFASPLSVCGNSFLQSQRASSLVTDHWPSG